MTILGNINLFVKDIAKARQFYTEVLGLVEDEKRSHPPSFILLKAGGSNLTLQDAQTPGAAFGESSIELGFAVDDIEVVRQRCVDAGIETGEVQQMGWGSGFDARDPEGHRLTIYKMRDGE